MTPLTDDNRAIRPTEIANETTGLTSDTVLLSYPSPTDSQSTSSAVARWDPEAQNREWEDQARDYICNSLAENTRKAYASDWRHFAAWCSDDGHSALPASPDSVALYLVAQAQSLKVSTLQRRLTTIAQVHQVAGFDAPTQSPKVRTVWRGIRRQLGVAPEQKVAAVTQHIEAMLTALPDSVAGLRTRALLLVGFSGALRRSEIVGLDRRDAVFGAQGIVLIIRRSKTDQESAGLKLGIPYGSDPKTCPVRALRAWLDASGITRGPLFRAVDRHGHISDTRLTGRAVASIVKRAAAAAGFDPTAFGAHSLRAGLITSAALAGVEERDIARQSRHRSTAVLRSYIRDADVWRDNVAGRVGL